MKLIFMFQLFHPNLTLLFIIFLKHHYGKIIILHILNYHILLLYDNY